MSIPIDILRCPRTLGSLKLDGAQLTSADGSASYPLIGGIARFLTEQPNGSDASATRTFYEGEGWERDSEGVFGDTKSFVDTREVPISFSRKCLRRLNKHFERGGRYLLDAGSGPIAHDELLEFGSRFERRVCVDLSAGALAVAREKVGDRGVFLQADLTNLPIQSNTIDAVTCNHVIYQVPAEQQASVFNELWRVLKPGGVAVIIYWWRDTPLQWRLERLARFFSKEDYNEVSAPTSKSATPNHFVQSLRWFETQPWPFRYEIEPFRVVGNTFMRHYVSDDWRGRLFLAGVFALQRIAPSYCGRYGQMPVIVLRKDGS